MTFCLTVASTIKEGKLIEAYEMWEKYASKPHYEIVVFGKDKLPICQYHTAKTTWKKKFKEITQN